MKVLKSYQHDPLGRQCAEAVKIKNMDPSKLINNRKEYHQPGDVEVIYQKNESEEMKNKKKATKGTKDKNNENPIRDNKNIDDCNDNENENTPTIIEFIKKMRLECEKKKRETVILTINTEGVEDEDITSTQNMLNDSRKRRNQKGNQSKCVNCVFKTGSLAILKQHMKTCQIEKANDNKENDTVETTNKINNSKRIHCKKCDKKFNKEKTYKIHMNNFHNITTIEGSVQSISIDKIRSNTNSTFHEIARTLRSNKSNDSALDLNS